MHLVKMPNNVLQFSVYLLNTSCAVEANTIVLLTVLISTQKWSQGTRSPKNEAKHRVSNSAAYEFYCELCVV